MAGTWLNSMLLPLELMQAWKYFQRYPNDSVFLRVVVGFSNFVNMTNTIGQYAGVYLVSPH